MASSDPDRSHSPAALRRRSPRSHAARAWRAVTSPYYRYRNAAVIHSVRVGLAMLVSILATTGINVPHGIWASVTLLVVIGGLQHQGNIRKKAAERAIGTLLGAVIGLVVILQANAIGSPALTYVLMSIVAGVCGYYAIGKPAYVALLTAITMCIVAGHGDNLISVGLWRTLNVLVGIVIALAFSFALPLYATYSWRYRFADNLRESARVYAKIMSGEALDAEAQVQIFLRLGKRLVQLRSLMPSVTKETGVPMSTLEELQRLHRSLLSALEMLSTAALGQTEPAARAAFAGAANVDAPEVRAALLAMARALRFAGAKGLRMANTPALGLPEREGNAAEAGSLAGTSLDLLGPCWLGRRIAGQVDCLRALLVETEPQWNIERHAAAS
ncbi:FUSC family protein [Paraburkholderia sp. SUR17]|uniref:FUSC family protein n=1 Tax=Paraburkholderia sp. SUR17 TaxID=3034358 RepID=UPI00240882C1|nr:FUSC family protein [Paraburkholderia sp. SUR17]WEY39613.1 FUSC family protein [Paraburkholderia sp. SUR17]